MIMETYYAPDPEQWHTGGPPSVRRLAVVGARVAITFPFDAALVAAVKLLAGARWDGRGKYWWVPAKAAYLRALLAWADEHDFTIPAELLALKEALWNEARANMEASRALDRDFCVEGLGGTLQPFQRAGVAYACRNKRVIIGDEMGLGKTVQALATLRALNALPAVVVCPASLVWNWQREAQKWLPGITVDVVTTGGQPLAGAALTVLSYSLLPKQLDNLRSLGPQAVIFDEAQSLRNSSTVRFKAAMALVRGVSVRLALSGTPLVNAVTDLMSIVQLLGRMEDFGGFWTFANRYCGAEKKSWGWDLTGRGDLKELAGRLRALCMVRRLKADVLTELPPKRRVMVPIDLAPAQAREYLAAKKDVLRWIADKAATDPVFAATLAGLDDDERLVRAMQQGKAAAERGARGEDLVRMNALMEISAAGKLPMVTDWVRSFLESGEPLVLFANRRAVIAALCKTFDCPAITGDTPTAERQKLVDAFQAGKLPLLIINRKAGGVGLTLTRATNVASVELGWTAADLEQCEDRVHRIGQRGAVTAWYFMGRGTIDWRLWEVIGAKGETAAGALNA